MFVQKKQVLHGYLKPICRQLLAKPLKLFLPFNGSNLNETKLNQHDPYIVGFTRNTMGNTKISYKMNRIMQMILN